MAKMAFLVTFRLIWLTKITLEGLKEFFFAKTFQILLIQYVSKPMSTLTQKMSKIPKPPLMAHCALVH